MISFVGHTKNEQYQFGDYFCSLPIVGNSYLLDDQTIMVTQLTCLGIDKSSAEMLISRIRCLAA